MSHWPAIISHSGAKARPWTSRRYNGPVPPFNAAELVNFVGFITGAVLYAMLLALVRRTPVRGPESASRDPLPLAAALLGLTWNLGELCAYLLPRTGVTTATVGLAAASFSALGLLAAVVVHSVARTLPRGRAITAGAYSCALGAAVLHIVTVITGDPSSSSLAFTILTICFSIVIVLLAVMTQRQSSGPRTLWMLALALFAISAAHLGRFHGEGRGWLVELAGHHAAIPLAFAILYQDYRFALADLFLKQALPLLALVAVAVGGYTLVASFSTSSSLAVAALLSMWIGTSLLYPWLRRRIVRFVDKVLLGREDYAAVRMSIGQQIAADASIETVLDHACARLGAVLNAHRVAWHRSGERPTLPTPALRVAVPTADPPHYEIALHDLAGGRRLLSDDEALAEAVATLAGRRIDSLRLTDERYERRLREEEMEKLAAEAELKALRAQINPHFLFNALTSIAYLIGASPRRALETLMRLTALLRGVLRSDGEFTTLGREVELVEHYLDIERARFEERLRVRIDVPSSLGNVRVPALILQPLVENAVKHGIGPSTAGGEVEVVATRRGDESVCVLVRNNGAPLADSPVSAPGRHIGLDNVERRLKGHYGGAVSLSLRSSGDGWTVAEMTLPITKERPTSTNAA
jgi:two-component system, LytTR family, sensor kinase